MYNNNSLILSTIYFSQHDIFPTDIEDSAFLPPPPTSGRGGGHGSNGLSYIPEVEYSPIVGIQIALVLASLIFLFVVYINCRYIMAPIHRLLERSTLANDVTASTYSHSKDGGIVITVTSPNQDVDSEGMCQQQLLLTRPSPTIGSHVITVDSIYIPSNLLETGANSSCLGSDRAHRTSHTSIT